MRAALVLALASGCAAQLPVAPATAPATPVAVPVASGQRDLPPPPEETAPPTVCRAGGAAPPGAVLIDDFEDGDTTPTLATLTGYWGAAHDDSPGGVRAPDPFRVTTVDACAANRGYARLAATGFRAWGAVMGLTFDGARRPVDLARYAGVQFWARLAEGGERSGVVRFRMSTLDTHPAGGTCETAGPDGTKGCHNHFGKSLRDLTTEWKLVTILFSELEQERGWGKQIAGGFDAGAVHGAEFHFPRGAALDLWVDDVAFIAAGRR